MTATYDTQPLEVLWVEDGEVHGGDVAAFDAAIKNTYRAVRGLWWLATDGDDNLYTVYVERKRLPNPFPDHVEAFPTPQRSTPLWNRLVNLWRNVTTARGVRG